jgi:hypothetical protein
MTSTVMNITLHDIVYVLLTNFDLCFSIRRTCYMVSSPLQFSEGSVLYCTTNTSGYVHVYVRRFNLTRCMTR